MMQPSLRCSEPTTSCASRCVATVGGELLPLTPTEFQLLVALASRPDAVLVREDLATRGWGRVDDGVLRSLQVHMRRLRSKLRAAAPQLRLVSRRGFGYQLVDDDALPAP